MNNTYSSNCARRFTLNVHYLAVGSEKPIPVEIKVSRNGGLEDIPLPILLNRPRCGQETRRTVAPAPRQMQFFNT